MKNSHSPTVIITFPNEIQKALFTEELQGQISDGMWENTGRTDWIWSLNVSSHVGPEPKITVTPAWEVGKAGFGFTKLIEHVGDRMVEIGKRFDSDYNEKKLRRDLRSIQRLIKSAKNPELKVARSSRPSYPDMGD